MSIFFQGTVLSALMFPLFFKVLLQWRKQKNQRQLVCLYCTDFHWASQQMYEVFIIRCAYWIAVIDWSFTLFDTTCFVCALRACIYVHTLYIRNWHMTDYCLDTDTQIKKKEESYYTTQSVWRQVCGIWPQPVKLALNPHTNTHHKVSAV